MWSFPGLVVSFFFVFVITVFVFATATWFRQGPIGLPAEILPLHHLG